MNDATPTPARGRGPEARGPDQRGPDQRGLEPRGPDQRGAGQLVSLRRGLLRRLIPGRLGRTVALWFILLTAVPLVIIGYVVIDGIHLPGLPSDIWPGVFDQARDAARSHLRAAAEARRIQLEEWEEGRQSDLYVLGVDTRVRAAVGPLLTAAPESTAYRSARDVLATRFSYLIESRTGFDEVFLTDREGRVVLSTAPQRTDTSVAGLEGFQQALSSRWIVPLFYDPDNSRPQFVILQPAVDLNGEVVGVYGGRLQAQDLFNIIESKFGLDAETTGAQTYVVNAAALPIGSVRYEAIQQNPYIHYTTEVVAAALADRARDCQTFVGSAADGEYADYAGQLVFGAYCPMPRYGAALIAERPQATVDDPVQVSVTRIAIALVGMFVVMIVIATGAAGLLAAPITELTAITARVAAGDLAQQVHVERRDEIGQLAAAFNRMTEQLRGVHAGLESTVARRTEQLRLAAEVSRAASELTDIDTLLPQVAELVRARYDFYYAGLFLLDELGASAVLRAGTGAAGRMMLARGHRLEVGGQSMVGWVTARNLPRIALDVGVEAVRFSNPLLPDTRSEAALPLRAAGRLIGALDVQSTRAAAFSEDDLAALQGLADQVAIAIDNARLYSQETRRADQRRQVVDIARRASAHRDVDELLQAVCDLTRQVFGYYDVDIALVEGNEIVVRAGAVAGRKAHPLVGVRFPLGSGLVGTAAATGEAILVQDVRADPRFLPIDLLPDTRAELVVPLTRAERVIGAIDIESDRLHGLDQGDLDLIQTLAGLVAVQVENVQLYEQTEASLREVSALYHQYTREAWQTGAEQGRLDREHTAPGVAPLAAPPLADLAQAVAAGDVVVVPEPEAPARSGLVAPVSLRGETIGALAVYEAEREREWSVDDQVLLQAASTELALALENARLFRQTQNLLGAEQQRRQLADTLREVAEAVSSTLELDELLNLILDQLQKVVAFDTASVQLLAGDQLVIIGGRGFAELDRVVGLRFALVGDNPNYEVFIRRAPQIVPDAPARYAHFREPPHDHIRAWLGVPLLHGERLLGMITLDSRRPNAFSPEQANLALAFANQAATAIRNAQLFEETQRRAAQFGTLNEVSRAVLAAATLEEVLDVIYRETTRLIPADGFFIALHDPAKDHYRYELLYDRGTRYPSLTHRPGPESHFARAIAEKRTVVVHYSPAEMAERGRRQTVGSGEASASLLFAPLLRGDAVIGVISAQTYSFNSYAPEHADLLGAIAAQTAAAIQNAHLFEETQRRAEQFATLNEISRAVLSTLTVEQMLDVIYNQTRRVIPLDAFFVTLYDEAANRLSYEFVMDDGVRYPGHVTAYSPTSNVARAIVEKRPLLVLRTPEQVEAQRSNVAGRIGDTRPSASMLFAPLQIGEHVIGVLSAQTYAHNSYGEEHANLLGAIANQAAAAIQNARLFAETRRRAEELAVLNEVSRAVSAVLSLEELYEVLHQQVSRLMDATSFYIALYDPASEMVAIPYMVERGQREPREPRPVTRGLTGHVIRSRQALNVREHIPETLARLGIDLVGTPSACWLGVPMFLGDEVLGLVAVQHYERERVYDEHDERVLQAIANQAAIAVQNARLFEQTQRRAGELASLYDLGTALTTRLEFENLLEVVFDQVRHLTGATAVSLAVGPNEREEIEIYSLDAGQRMPLLSVALDSPTSFLAHLVRTGEALLVRDLRAERASLPVAGQVRGEEPLSWLGVPLQLGDRRVGALAVQSYEAGRFDRTAERLLRQVGLQVAIALDNARLFASTEQARRQAEERLRESMALQAISRAVSRTLELDEVLDIVLEQIVYTLGFEFGLVALVDERENAVKAVRGVGVSAAQLAAVQRRLDDNDIVVDVIRTGKTEVIAGWDERFDRELYEREGHAELVRIWTPIVSRGRAIGVVEAGFHRHLRATISDDEVRLVQAFVDQAAIGIENSRLFAETQRRAVQLSTAAEVSHAATAMLDPDELVREAVRLIRERFGFYYVAVFLLDADGRFATLKEATGEAGQVLKSRGHRLEVGGQSMVGAVVASGRARIALDVGAEAVRFANPLLPETRSEIALPLRVGDRVVGALDVQSTLPGAFVQEDVDILQSMADQLATAIDNARLFQDSLARTREVTALFDAGQQLNTTLELAALYEIVARRLLETSRVEAVTVSDWERDENRVVTRAHVSSGPDKVVDVVGTSYTLELYAFKRRVLAEAAPLTVRLADEELDRQEIQLLRRAHMGAELLIPLSVRDNVVGLVTLYAGDPQRRFGPDEIRFATTLVNQAAVAIQNARLFGETQVALSETAALYQAGRAISAAGSPEEILNAVLDNVAPPDVEGAVLLLAGAERRPGGQPEYFEGVAAWGPRAPELALARYTAAQLPILQQLNPFAPVTFDDVATDPRVDPRSRQLLAGQRVRSLGSIPLALANTNQWIGLVLVVTLEPHLHRFNDREVRLYHTLAGQAAVQLDRLRAENALARRANQLAASAEVSRAAASVLDLDELLRTSVELIRERFGFYHVQVFLRDEAGRHVALRASTGPVGRQLLSGGRALDSGAGSLVGAVLAGGEARVAQAGAGDPLYRPHPLLPEMRAELAVPLRVGDQLLGVLDVHSRATDAFGPDDTAILSALADQLGVAISNALLFAESRQRIAELGLLFDVTTAAAGSTRMDEVLQRSVQALHGALGDAQVAIFLLDGDALSSRAHAGYAGLLEAGLRIPLGRGVIGWVAESGQPAVIGDVSQDSRYQALDPRVRSELAVPLLAGQQVIGVLNVERPRVEAFSQNDLRLLTTLSTTLAAAIRNAQLFEEIEAANERLREVDRLKSEFLASMSHELRTPLNSIIGFSRVILKGIDGPLTELQQTDLTAIHSAGQHLLGLINDILDLSKIEAGKLELAFDEVNLSEVIRGVMTSAIGLTRDKPITLHVEMPADLPAVWADQIRIRQAVLNLVANAAKFTDQGSITVRAAVVHDRPLRADGDGPLVEFVRVSVIDTGIGIAGEDMPKLFQAFQQVDSSSSRRAGGTGLGLNITKQLVELHGGRIGLSSQYGHGSTFWFTVPVHPEPVSPPEPPGADGQGDTRRIVLAVDDDPGVITLYRRYLEPQGYRVVGVNRSDEVLQRVRELRPFVITLDVLMPHKDGWQVIQELKREPDTRAIPVIMASIIAEQGRGFSLGAADYLVKPILEQDLLAAVRRLDGEGQERTVLIIDDEADNIRLIRRVLEGEAHYRVFEAQGGREGLEAVASLRPHIVVLDLMMPEVDGFEVLAALKSNPETRPIPVIVVTAKDITAEDRDRLNGYVGALLRKGPLTESELLQDVSRVLEQAARRAGLPVGGEPAAAPAAAPPVNSEPGAGEVVAGEVVAGEPVAGEPATGQPAAGQPAAGQPV
jgi:GAF domain-containing protein/CheY-like chemotaxis protein/HAMP domain-containing protein